ncbi:MAG: TVP38/TMEM64 family protein [Clostridia bacterium]|nr:TVP38/TMEM64 family protein [Clostridia bacterium]
MVKSKIIYIKSILLTIVLGMIGATGVVFSVLYFQTFKSGFLFDNNSLFTSVSISVISLLTVLSIVYFRRSHALLFRLFIVFTLAITLLTLSLYLFKSTGLLDTFSSIEGIRDYVEGVGKWASLLFVFIQILQVVILPIPSFILIGAGVLLFGTIKGAILSSLGVVLGSLTSFYIGRIFGYKLAKWLFGEHKVSKWIRVLEGKGKILFALMFIFPLFPDDLLCVVAGITSMKASHFLTLTLLTRPFSVFISSLSIGNSLIPYNTWWGIVLWILVFVAIFFITTKIYKFLISKSENKVKQ